MSGYEDQVSGVASTQYNDLEGTAAADNADFGSGGLRGLAKRIAGEDAGWPISVSWFVHARGDKPFVHVSLYVIPPEHGISNQEEAVAWVGAQRGETPVNRYTTASMSPDEFLALFKRFDVVLSRRNLRIDKLNVVSSYSVDDGDVEV